MTTTPPPPPTTSTPDSPPFTFDSQIANDRTTILCIARMYVSYLSLWQMISLATGPMILTLDRLRTVIAYGVMDNGNIAEFDDPETLYAQNGIFWGQYAIILISLWTIFAWHASCARSETS